VLNNYKTIGILLLAAVILILAVSPVQAAVSGFVARDNDGTYYKYPYKELLDSYALKILGEPSSLYDDYAEKEVYALKDSVNGYIDYQDVLDRFAEAMALGESFDLDSYTESDRAKKAEMPPEIKLARVNDGSLQYSSIRTLSDNPLPDFDPPGRQTPIVGAAGASVEQAQKWAKQNDAHQRLIDIAPEYWSYGEKTGLRPEVLYVQAAHASGFGHFSNGVDPDFNNWAGILRAERNEDSPDNYERFDSPEEGVRAHFNHMIAYVGLKPIGEPHSRYQVVYAQPWAGSVINVDDLSGKWASDENYHIRILYLLDQLKNTVVEDKREKEEKEPAEEKAPDRELAEAKQVAVDVSEVTVLHLRAGPSTDHDILDRLVRGTVLEVVESKGQWLEVITPGKKEGWVHGDYVRPIDLTENPFKGKKVVIDPGHGGVDSGAIGITGLLEKEVTLDVAEKLQKMLEEAGASVIMTREGDRSTSNRTRVEVANDSGADVFVSIHANAYSNPESNGTETFYCSNNSNRDASRYLAQQLQRELISELQCRDRGVKTRSFYVLKETEMPSALVELAFLTNKEEEELLRTAEARVGSAEALFKGLEAYFRKYR